MDTLRLLVIGASGFLGKNFLLATPRSWEIKATYNTSVEFPQFVRSSGLDQVEPINCDLRIKESVQELCQKIGRVDATLYLAADTYITRLSQDLAADVMNNILPLTNLLTHLDGGKFIFFSSGAVYVGLAGEVSADTPVTPTIPYAISKLTSEQYIKFAQSRKKIDDYVIVRFFGAYGRFEPERKITRRLLLEILNAKSSLIGFTVYGDGQNFIDIMYIDDAVRGMMSILDSKKSDVTVDMCVGSPLTINEYVRRIADFFNKEVDVHHVGGAIEYITFYANPDRAYRLFNFKPTTELRDGIIKYMEWLSMGQGRNY